VFTPSLRHASKIGIITVSDVNQDMDRSGWTSTRTCWASITRFAALQQQLLSSRPRPFRNFNGHARHPPPPTPGVAPGLLVGGRPALALLVRSGLSSGDRELVEPQQRSSTSARSASSEITSRDDKAAQPLRVEIVFADIGPIHSVMPEKTHRTVMLLP
jgi:hypothetical protein